MLGRTQGKGSCSASAQLQLVALVLDILQHFSDIRSKNTTSSLLVDLPYLVTVFCQDCCGFIWFSPVAMIKACDRVASNGPWSGSDLLLPYELENCLQHVKSSANFSLNPLRPPRLSLRGAVLVGWAGVGKWQGMCRHKLLLTIPALFSLLFSYGEGLALVSHLQSQALAFWLCNIQKMKVLVLKWSKVLILNLEQIDAFALVAVERGQFTALPDLPGGCSCRRFISVSCLRKVFIVPIFWKCSWAIMTETEAIKTIQNVCKSPPAR